MTTTDTPRTAAPRMIVPALLLALALAPRAGAQGIVANPVVGAQILPGWTTARGTRMAALRLELAPGWHTYWRIPGEAGIAPQFDWSQSQNVASVTPIWPRPEVFDQNGYVSFGYQDALILPIEITPQDPSRPIALVGDIAIGVCERTCVPADVTVSGALRGAGAADPRISDALAERAEPGARAGLSRATCHLEPAQRGAELTLRATLPRLGRSEHLVVELPGTGYWISDSRTSREGGDLVARARVRAPQRGAVSIDRATLAFTILSEARMVTAQGCTGAP